MPGLGVVIAIIFISQAATQVFDELRRYKILRRLIKYMMLLFVKVNFNLKVSEARQISATVY